MIILMLVVGGKASGKTTITKTVYFDKIDRRNKLVFDHFNEYLDIEEIKLNDIPKFYKNVTGEIRRVVCNGQLSIDNYTDIFLQCLKDFNNGVLIADCFVDMAHSSEINDKITELLARSRQLPNNLEIVMHFNNEKYIPKQWLRFDENINYQIMN